MLPNLLVIGAMKCATSSICSFFETHPDVFFLPDSEPDFFSVDENWSRGVASYERLFQDAADFSAIGEGSNSYSNIDIYPETPGRIKSVLPDARMIYSVRHPMERIVSTWAQIRMQSPDEISHDINAAVRENPEYTVYPSFYGRQMESYLEHFVKEQIWIGFLEDLKNDNRAFFTSLCQFVSIAPSEREKSAPVWKNPTGGRPILGARYTRLRQAPGATMLKALLPAGLKDAAKKMMSAPTPSTAELMARLDLPEALRAALIDDARRFLELTERPRDFWKF